MLDLEEFKQSRLYRGMMEMAKEDAKQEVVEEVKEQIREEVKEQIRKEVKEQSFLETVPLLLELGLSVEEIAQRLNLTVEQVRQAAQSQSN